MTRERLPAGTVLQKAYGVLDKYKISRAFFVKTDQETCALTADDINEGELIGNDEGVRSAAGPDSNSVKVPEVCFYVYYHRLLGFLNFVLF